MSFPTLRASLRTKLVAAFLVVALIPLGVLAFLNDQSARVSLTEAASRSLFAAASQTATSLDSFFQANLNAIGSEAQLPALSSYLSLPVAQRSGSTHEAEVRGLLTALKTKENRGYATISSYAFIQSYFLLDEEGQLLLTTATSEESLDHAERDYFKEATGTSEPYISPVEFSSRGEASIYFAASVRDNVNRYAGVLVMRYNAIVLQQLLVPNNNVAGAQSYGVLLDENNLRLAHGTTPELLYKLIERPTGEEVATLQEALRLPNRRIEQLAIEQSSLAVYLEEAEKQHSSFTTEGSTGEAEQVAVTTLISQPWTVAFFQPQSVFLAPAREQSQRTFFLGLGSAAGVALLAIFFARRMSAPIIELASGARRVAQGQLDQPVRVRSRDELGSLARSFNAMQKTLQDSYEQLQHRVTELSTLQQVSMRLGARLDQSEVLEAVIEGVMALVGPTEIRLFFYDEEKDELRFAAFDDETLAKEGNAYPPRRDGLTAQVARTGQALFINDPAKHPFYAEMVQEWPLQALASIPIRRAERTLAVLNVSFVGRAYQFTDDDMRALSVLAEQAALALDNAQLHQQTQAALHSTETLYRAAWAITAAKTLQEICQNLATYSNSLVQAYSTHLYLVDHEKQQIVLSANAGNYVHELQSYGELERGLSGQVYQSGKPLLSLHADDGIEPEATRSRR
nr:GAF domain-containing protein [Ardenticatenales bacterium]